MRRDPLGRLKEGAYVDVEADVGEPCRNDLLATVVAILADLREQDARSTTLTPEKARGESPRFFEAPRIAHRPSVHPMNGSNLGLMTAEHLFEREAHLTDRGTRARRVDGSLEQISGKRPGSPGRDGAGCRR